MMRSDGRGNLDWRPFSIEHGTIQEAFGSSAVTFGEQSTKIVCSIKAEVATPMPSEPNRGPIVYHLESVQTGSSLYTRQDEAETTKDRMLHIISSLYRNVIDRAELLLYKGEFAWRLNVDILVFDELRLHQLDFIC